MEKRFATPLPAALSVSERLGGHLPPATCERIVVADSLSFSFFRVFAKECAQTKDQAVKDIKDCDGEQHVS